MTSTNAPGRSGPLTGFRVIELAAKGPCPMCGMLLSDLGADVIRIERAGEAATDQRPDTRFRFLERGRRSILIDLKRSEGRRIALALIGKADALIEGFRPGVMERLGLGPDECFAINARLVYGRVTGWGQRSPLSATAGHDINYIALTGALAAIGEQSGPPVVPLNLLGDFGGGAAYLAIGLLSALLEAQRSGRGQVVDVAMTDAVVSLMTAIYAAHARGDWVEERGGNFLDGGAHYYGIYKTKDGKYLAVGAIEDKFCQVLFGKLGLEVPSIPHYMDRASWEPLKRRIASIVQTKTRKEWEQIFEGSDACVAPVLSMTEAMRHPQNVVRNAFVQIGGVEQPAPAPRFSRTQGVVQSAPVSAGENTGEILREFGFLEDEIRSLKAEDIIRSKCS